jgi:predicted ribosomally synthesized peptide with SipW-like signal peptide
MKRILASLLTIAVVAVVGVVVTRAYFSDTETSKGNTITAGTIDISVNDQNPWTKNYSDQLADMKPGMVREVSYVVRNVGANPVVVWKQVHVTGTSTGTVTVPECTTQLGIWDTTNNACDWQGHTDKNDLYNVITYDMKANDAVLIDGAWNVTMNDIDAIWVPLGRIETGQSITVKQSYHMLPTAGNEYQGDTMTFDISIYAEQIGGTGPGPTTTGLVLENKDTSWNPIIDGRWGLLTWNPSSRAFTFSGHGLTVGTSYSLIYYHEPQTTWPTPVTVIQSGTSTDGTLTLTGILPASLHNAKIWLVETNDLSGSSMSGWTSANYLFESNLINTGP